MPDLLLIYTESLTTENISIIEGQLRWRFGSRRNTYARDEIISYLAGYLKESVMLDSFDQCYCDSEDGEVKVISDFHADFFNAVLEQIDFLPLATVIASLLQVPEVGNLRDNSNRLTKHDLLDAYLQRSTNSVIGNTFADGACPRCGADIVNDICQNAGCGWQRGEED